MKTTRREFIKAIGALVGTGGAVQFAHQLESMARALEGPQEWVLSFDDGELTDLIKRGIRIGKTTMDKHGRLAVECTLEFETAYLWALATLTGPDGGEWQTVDGETWTQGERKMTL